MQKFVRPQERYNNHEIRQILIFPDLSLQYMNKYRTAKQMQNSTLECQRLVLTDLKDVKTVLCCFSKTSLVRTATFII